MSHVQGLGFIFLSQASILGLSFWQIYWVVDRSSVQKVTSSTESLDLNGHHGQEKQRHYAKLQ
jgi:hypothetical protein